MSTFLSIARVPKLFLFCSCFVLQKCRKKIDNTNKIDKMKKINTQNNVLQLIKCIQFCRMEIHIGSVVQQVFKKSKIRATELAELLHFDRSNVYAIFKRKSLDTDTLWALSKIFKHNFFEYYSNAFKGEFPDVVKEPEVTYQIEKKRRVMVEVELTEREYQDLISKKR
jgi:hypothetical protein